MSQPEPYIILYPETCVVLCDHLADDRFQGREKGRIIAFVSCSMSPSSEEPYVVS